MGRVSVPALKDPQLRLPTVREYAAIGGTLSGTIRGYAAVVWGSSLRPKCQAREAAIAARGGVGRCQVVVWEVAVKPLGPGPGGGVSDVLCKGLT